jgi:hypothetical protein
MHYSIPEYGIEVEVTPNGTGSITSNMKDDHDAEEYNAAVDGLEALILGHACAGIDICSPAYITGIRSAWEALVNHF